MVCLVRLLSVVNRQRCQLRPERRAHGFQTPADVWYQVSLEKSATMDSFSVFCYESGPIGIGTPKHIVCPGNPDTMLTWDQETPCNGIHGSIIGHGCRCGLN